MRQLTPLAALALAALLAGCTAAEDAQNALTDAQEKLVEAQQEAADAKARFERVRSATIIREEIVALNLTIRITNGTLSFEPNATRDGTPIPRENLTRLPDVRIEAPSVGLSAQCEPLTCNARVPSGFTLTVAWADRPDDTVRVANGAVLFREDARVKVTTDAGDVTA